MQANLIKLSDATGKVKITYLIVKNSGKETESIKERLKTYIVQNMPDNCGYNILFQDEINVVTAVVLFFDLTSNLISTEYVVQI
jgi:hypothetical protein